MQQVLILIESAHYIKYVFRMSKISTAQETIFDIPKFFGTFELIDYFGTHFDESYVGPF